MDSLNIHNRIYGGYDDDTLYKIIQEEFDLESISQLEKLEKSRIIKEIKIRTGGSNRQLSRILGIGKRIVDSAVR